VKDIDGLLKWCSELKLAGGTPVVLSVLGYDLHKLPQPEYRSKNRYSRCAVSHSAFAGSVSLEVLPFHIQR
jgi:hypothetical protein